jgi:serine/threonine protein kinase
VSDAVRWQRVKATFQEALDRPQEARESYLVAACAGDPALRREVDSLLAAQLEAGRFLSDPAAVPAPAPDLEGRRIGPYRILGRIGQGGMGVVYRAVRDDDVFQKTVAFKLVHLGASPEHLRRFGRERQILARLQHPNIATILDGGATDEGQPYLVMEHVLGEPIDVYCRLRALGTRQRLELFRTVCAAVHFAHQNLVVHRDLKPANVLVDGEGQPKLLDFGIARLLADGLEPDAVQTATLLPMMTPEYASPEQVRGETVTTATDVYSLGVMLYELLTGRRPYPVKKDSLEEIVRAVCETEPVAPSVAALEAAGAPPHHLRGDLDTIVLKALRKEPGRRYASALDLSEDLRRHLEGRPVTARKDTLRYRATRFVSRNRLAVSAASILVASLLAALLATLGQAHVARRERDAAERARARNEALVDFMLGDLQAKLEPSNRQDVVADLATQVLKSLDTIPPGERTPATKAQRARVLVLLGTTRQNQGEVQGADESLREAIALLDELGATASPPPGADLTLAEARTQLSRTLADKGDSEGALAAARAGEADWRRLLAPMPDDSERRAGLGNALNELGRVLLVSGSTEEALRAHLEAVALLESLPPAFRERRDVAIQLYNAHLYAGRDLEFRGQFEPATEQFRIGIEQATRYSERHPADNMARHQVSVITNDLGRTLRKLERLDEAAAAFEKALAITREVVERDPTNNFFRADLSACHAFLGRVRELRGDLPGACEHFRADVAIMEELTAKEPDNGAWRGFLADGLTSDGRALMGLGRLLEAKTRHQRALDLRSRSLAANRDDVVAQADVAESRLELGRVKARLGDEARARAEWTEGRALLERALQQSEFGYHRLRFARTLLELGEVERARPVVERLLRERFRDPELLELCRRRGIPTDPPPPPAAAGP